ncbi:hypothetical protein [Streptomyces sanglieri]|uniref:hypothetical protein n=1 Tax=Streptomyces sanglieri TaxID=193460 RepID=UPI003524DE91
MNRNRMRHGLMLALATVVFGGLSITTGPSASAATTLVPKVFKNPFDGDTGGVSAYAQLREYQGVGYIVRYQAVFHAEGETLEVWDRLTDGSEATVVLKVYDRDNNLVDTDKFTTGKDHTFNLGTPDGSGNITEGYKVRFILSGGGYTTPPIEGIA